MLALLLLMVTGPVRTCPITHQAVNDESPSACVSGVEFRFVTEQAKAQFLKDPAGSLAGFDTEAVVGVSFFDPVTGKSMILSRDGHIREADLTAVTNWVVRNGIAYPLAVRSKRAFNGNPSLYTIEPQRFSVWCSIMRKPIASIEKATGYVDVTGTRYFVCCESCLAHVRGDRAGAGWEEAAAESKPWIRLTKSP